MGVAPSGFGGPGPGAGTGELTDEQMATLCTVREKINLLQFFDIVGFMAENYARAFDVKEELIEDILENGHPACGAIDAARLEEERLSEIDAKKAEQEKIAMEIAAREAFRPKPINFAVGEDGYPVSSDMVWNACIRNVQLFIDGQDRPVNCRRYHRGHSWEHPDTLISFDWSDRFVKRVGVHGYTVATYTVPTPDILMVKDLTVVNGNVVAKYILPMTQYIAQRGKFLYDKLIVKNETVDPVVLDEETIVISVEEDETAVLSEQTTIVE